jgi:type VI secretion system protein ImpF
MPSIIDRLTRSASQPSGGPGIGIRELKISVRRDLEWLLNSRRLMYEEIDAGLEESRKSILTYGMPDLSVYSRNSPSDIKEICDYIKEIIKSFEPRLMARTVEVKHITSDAVDDFQLHFRIEGTLHVDPIIEPISFDTVLELESGSVQVQEFE